MIQELIKAKVLSMNANGLTYSFLHSEPEWQNIVADNATLPAVYMDMPVQFTPVVKTGGGYERRYVATCLFLFKSNLDDNETQRYDSLKLAETAQRQFHLMLNQDDVNFKNLEVSQCYQVQNLFDCNLDGVVMPFTFTERNTNSVCVPSSAPSGVVTVQLNSQTFLSIDCGNTQNITLTDVLGNELTGYEVVGSNIKIKNSVVTNSIDDVLADLAPQENIELSDVDNIDSDGSTVPTPAGVPFTCTPVAPCADATVTLNSVTMDTIPSGDTENIQVLQSSGMTEVGSKQGVHWRIADSDISLNSSAFLSIKAEDGQDIELVDQDDTTITPLSIVGNKITVDVPVCTDGWQRPDAWEDIPSISTGEQVAYILMAVHDTYSEKIALRVQGDYTIDWGDGTIENISSGVKAEHSYDFSTIVTPVVTGFSYKQCLIKITPNGGNITYVSFEDNHTGVAFNSVVTPLDMVLNLPNATVFRFFSEGYQKPTTLERCWIKEHGTITGIYRGFKGMSALQSCPLFDTSNVTDFSYWWSDCYLIKVIEAFDMSSGTTLTYAFYNTKSLTEVNIINTGLVTNFVRCLAGSNLRVLPSNIDMVGATNTSEMLDACPISEFYNLDTTNVTDANYMFNAQEETISIEMDCTGLTGDHSQFPRTYNLRKFLPHNMTVGFNVANCNMTAEALDAMFTVLGTASGAQTITVTGNDGAGTCDTSIATGKGFTVNI